MLSLVFAGSHGKTVRDGLVCPQIRTDPHRLEALAKPWKFGRGSVPAALDSPPHGQRGRCPSRVAKFLRESSLPVALHSAILIHARSSLPMAWLNPSRSSQSKFQETIVPRVSRVPFVPPRYLQSAKHLAAPSARQSAKLNVSHCYRQSAKHISLTPLQQSAWRCISSSPCG